MKHVLLAIIAIFFINAAKAQETYTMGYKKATITAIDQHYFYTYSFPNKEVLCGIYDNASNTFYTCDYHTIRDINEEYIAENKATCCDVVDFDPAKYYGTLTLLGVIDSVEWDNLTYYVTTDKARIKVVTDEKEIDALYKEFYENNKPGKVHIKLKLITYDTVNEDVLSYNKNSKKIRKQKRIFLKFLRY